MPYKIFTVSRGHVEPNAKVEVFTLKGAGVSIPVILVGESGRGRALGVLPVSLAQTSQKVWEEKGAVDIYAASVGTTKAGNLKLFESPAADDESYAIVVLRTPIGFRGSNSHTGDRLEDYWVRSIWCDELAFLAAGIPAKAKYTKEEVEQYTPLYQAARITKWDEPFELQREFLPFPGEFLVTGSIAQGAAGRAGGGTQGIAVIPEGVVFRTGYGGRLYGAPSAHYYVLRDGEILAATWEERQISDLF